MKDVQMTFRVVPDMRASFNEATEAQHRPAAQVLREFMRAYVAKVGKTAEPVPAISATERRQREKTVAFARANVGLEGFTPSAEAEARALQYIEGAIDLDTFISLAPSTTA